MHLGPRVSSEKKENSVKTHKFMNLCDFTEFLKFFSTILISIYFLKKYFFSDQSLQISFSRMRLWRHSSFHLETKLFFLLCSFLNMQLKIIQSKTKLSFWNEHFIFSIVFPEYYEYSIWIFEMFWEQYTNIMFVTCQQYKTVVWIF